MGVIKTEIEDNSVVVSFFTLYVIVLRDRYIEGQSVFAVSCYGN